MAQLTWSSWRYGSHPRYRSAFRDFYDRVVRPRRRILFFPEVPDHGYVVHKLCAVLNYQIVADPAESWDIAFKFHDATVTEVGVMRAVSGLGPVVNGDSLNIGKQQVSEAFEEVFGYPIAVDPTVYRGTAVRKSIRNATHDAVLVDCPVSGPIEKDVVYQRFIETRSSGEMCVDFRVPVYGDRIPLVVEKRRSSSRFWPTDSVRLVETSEVFDEEEQLRIVRFAREMGIEFGELDVLRDRDDGRIYVVDANNTPWGPGEGYADRQRKDLVNRLAEAFDAFTARWIGVRNTDAFHTSGEARCA